MSFDRNLLPEPVSYFENQGLKVPPRGKWRSIECKFHGGKETLRFNATTGAWVCMSCGVKGGDVLAYEMQSTGAEFVDAAKALGAWVDDGKPQAQHKPTPLSARDALSVLNSECNLIAVSAGNVAHGVALTQIDLTRVMQAAGRVATLSEAFA